MPWKHSKTVWYRNAVCSSRCVICRDDELNQARCITCCTCNLVVTRRINELQSQSAHQAISASDATGRICSHPDSSKGSIYVNESEGDRQEKPKAIEKGRSRSFGWVEFGIHTLNLLARSVSHNNKQTAFAPIHRNIPLSFFFVLATSTAHLLSYCLFVLDTMPPPWDTAESGNIGSRIFICPLSCFFLAMYTGSADLSQFSLMWRWAGI